MLKTHVPLLALLWAMSPLSATVFAQEQRPAAPYFVAYDHHMEERGTLEISNVSIPGQAEGVNPFLGNWTEFEYGTTNWWTTELYIDWQHTRHESSVFTGVRFENRFRPWSTPHWINPVLYIEYEHLNGADKILKEIVGFDGTADLAVANSEARLEHEREIETKLILSSDIGAWNLSENVIGAKNLHGGPWEFGYAVALSRPLATPSGSPCTFCARSFAAGVEVYGGLGEWDRVTLSGTSHYVAPVLQWTLPTETSIRISPGWGVTDQSVGFLFRIGVSQEIDNIGHHLKKPFSRP
jgi:hypothetical protein